ncbi:hypothetical protein [Kaistia adipata]|uniref:hypothetical protein n=1 Tax=Kaistia adipata TaxID=166954 RepID=UPI0003FC6908|nr:hypothetical protein [Kaistia adipata]
MTAITTADITAQIAAIDGILADIEIEASRLSYAAVSGDAAAVQLLAESNARAAQLTVDRGVLVRAMVTAKEIEEKARLDQEEATRLGHLTDARAAAIQLLRISERADALTKNCADVVTELNEAEERVRHSFRLAGEPLNIGRVGRDGISESLVRNLNNCRARGDFATKKGVADIVRGAWGELLEEDSADE